jgi:hypothetical protein
MRERVFILSPAWCSGERTRIIMRHEATFDLARRLREPEGAPLGEVFAFLSGLYFRGKLAYATRFARPPAGLRGGVFVVTSCQGLVPPDEHIDIAALRAFAEVPIAVSEPRYSEPLVRDLEALKVRAPEADVVLLGSIATDKYVVPLQRAFGDRITVPAEFAGRGDMSRGGLLLRCVEDAHELTYVPITHTGRHGPRPERVTPRAGILGRAIKRAGGSGPTEP